MLSDFEITQEEMFVHLGKFDTIVCYLIDEILKLAMNSRIVPKFMYLLL